MGAVSGDVNSANFVCADPSDLSSRSVAGLASGDQAWVVSLELLAPGPRFYYSANSVLPLSPDVFATSSGVGRWLSERNNP